MADLNKYRVWCTTDNKYEFTDYRSSVPSVCPANPAHSIDAVKTTIVDSVSDGKVEIKEENTPTGKNFRTKGYVMTIPAGSVGDVTNLNVSFPFPVSLLSGGWKAETENNGDDIKFFIAKDIGIGDITADVAIGAKVIDADASAMSQVKVGYEIELDDAVNNDNIGDVVDVDQDNNRFTVTDGPANAFAAATPTNIKLNILFIDKNTRLFTCEYQSVGISAMGGQWIPANQVMKLKYTNNTTAAKKFRFILEYYY